jgi:hypothetical protein
MPLRTSTFGSGARPSEGLAFGLHVPAGMDQFADHLGQRFEAQAPRGGVVAGRAQAEFLEFLARRALGFGVADQVDALLGEPEPAAGRGGLRPAAAVVQQQERLKVLLAPGVALLRDAQAQARLHAALLELERLVDVQRRHHVEVQQFGHDAVAFPVRKRDLLQGDQARDPGECAAIVERAILPCATRNPPSTISEPARSTTCAPRRGAASR